MAGRQYKKDLSDIVGILNEQQKQGKPITFEMIDNAVVELYGSWDKIEKQNVDFLKSVLEQENLDILFDEVMQEELDAKSTILEINKNYPGLVKADNINEILEKARKKKE